MQCLCGHLLETFLTVELEDATFVLKKWSLTSLRLLEVGLRICALFTQTSLNILHESSCFIDFIKQVGENEKMRG